MAGGDGRSPCRPSQPGHRLDTQPVWAPVGRGQPVVDAGQLRAWSRINGLLASAAVTEVLKLVTGFAVEPEGSREWHYDPCSENSAGSESGHGDAASERGMASNGMFPEPVSGLQVCTTPIRRVRAVLESDGTVFGSSLTNYCKEDYATEP